MKGTDGPDWVLACVLLDIRAAIVTDARIGYGHCERMTWHRRTLADRPRHPTREGAVGGPGSDLALQAGWRTFQTG